MATGDSAAEAGDYVMAGSGLVIAIGSFLNFLEVDLGDTSGDDEFAELGAALFGVFETSWTGWSNAWSLFPLVTLSVLTALGVGGLAVMRRFSNVQVPARLGGVSVQGLSVLVAGFAVVSVAAPILRSLLDTGSDEDGGLAVGPGAWALLVGMVGLLVGASLPAATGDTDEPDPSDGDDDGPVEPGPRSEGTWILLGAGTLTLVGSFLPVLGSSGTFGDLDESGGAEHAWTAGLRPVFGLPAVMGVVVMMLVVAAFMERPLGLGRFGISAADLKLAVSVYAVFASFALLIGNPVFGNLSGLVEAKFGHYLMLIGAIALVAGCLVERSTPPSPVAEAP